MDANLFGPRLETVLDAAFETASGTVLVVNPGPAAVEALIDVVGTADVNVQVLASEDALKTVFDDFIVASTAADLVDAGTLALRTTADLPRASLLVDDESVLALVEAGDRVAGLAADETEFVTAAAAVYGDDWADADPFTLRTPAISRVRDSLSADISPDVEADFDAVLASLDTARGDGDGLDEVTISLLVAAKNRVLLYDISKWGEDVGIASKATFSRTKTRLEDLGLIDTEKVPIDVGRPRLRLQLADERLRDADAADLASVASSVLAS